LETTGKLLILLKSFSTIFSKCALKSLYNQADFDSAIRRFDPPAPASAPATAALENTEKSAWLGADAQPCDTLLPAAQEVASRWLSTSSPRGNLLLAAARAPRGCHFPGAPACFYELADDEPGDGASAGNPTLAYDRQPCRTKGRRPTGVAQRPEPEKM
jgi:hypothetical protein